MHENICLSVKYLFVRRGFLTEYLGRPQAASYACFFVGEPLGSNGLKGIARKRPPTFTFGRRALGLEWLERLRPQAASYV